MDLQYGYDRVDAVLDHSDPDSQLVKNVSPLCGGGASLRPYSAKFQRLWKSKIELLQPTKKAIRMLRDLLKDKGYNIQLQSVEFACDFIAQGQCDAELLRNFWLRHVVQRYARQLVELDKHCTTFYYGRRITESGIINPNVLTVYADQPSKIAGRCTGYPCLHCEFRIKGPAALPHAGIVTLDDLLTFNHAEFWEKNIYLVNWKSKQVLGQFLDLANLDVSKTTLRKRADEFIRDYELNGVFIMQNAFLENEDLRRALKWIDPCMVFRS